MMEKQGIINQKTPCLNKPGCDCPKCQRDNKLPDMLEKAAKAQGN